MNFHSSKTRKKIATVIIVMVIVAMIAPMVLAVL